MSTIPIARLLADELVCLRQFVELLKEEQATLIDGKADNLPGITERKASLATRLTEGAKQRDAAQGELGLPPGRAGMEDWLKSEPSGSASRRHWIELLPLAAEAKTLNELNGKLIGTRLQYNQQALAALMGATELAMTYGPDGHTQVSGGGRSLGSA